MLVTVVVVVVEMVVPVAKVTSACWVDGGVYTNRYKIMAGLLL